MKMTGHNTISIYLQAFVFLAMPNTIQEDIFVFISDEDIELLNGCEGDKNERLMD
jgi:hypothetical protein